jgi:uncharacterized protein (DUF1800 family)
MPRLLAAIATSALVIFAGTDDSPFQKRLTPERRIAHALNRLTYGPRPGDLDAVRKIGVEKWIDTQLHPERIAENPVLDAKLKPLETLRMTPEEILKDYAPPQFGPTVTPLRDLVSADQLRQLNRGTAEQRKNVLDALDAEKRQKVMAELPPDSFEGQPDLKKEAEAARKARQEENQKEFRKRMPPLNDLLSQDQLAMVFRASPEQITELLSYFEPAKRMQLIGALPPQALSEFPELRRQAMKQRQPIQAETGDLREGKLFRAIYSNRQFEEVLVDFWYNHFNVYEAKANVNLRPLLASYERDAIRPNVLGHFKDLLLATARHPAMLYYLDNWESMSKDALDIGPFAPPVQQFAQQLTQQARGINENYGRELMELHTLGVDGGYTQDDVIAVARCFTGWTIRDPNKNPRFVFAGFMHDVGEKTILGRKIPAGGGEQDGLQAIDILVHYPSTAKFISKELAMKFVSDDPPQALVDRMAQTFIKTDGDLRAIVQTMIESPEFFSEGAFQSKIKSPFEMVVSAVRGLGATVNDTWTLAQKTADLGEPLYGKQEPTGYPLKGDVWLSSSNLFGRINFGTALTSGVIPGVKIDNSLLPPAEAGAMARWLLSAEPSADAVEAIRKGLEGHEPTARFIAGMVIGSPDFQKR